jgi:hypothetical protein
MALAHRQRPPFLKGHTMRNRTMLWPALLGAALACGSAAAQEAGARLTPPAVAAEQKAELARGDPQRWYENDATLRARLANLRKEIGAAYAEAKIACQKGPQAERAGCLKEARSVYRQDLANARDLAMASR